MTLRTSLTRLAVALLLIGAVIAVTAFRSEPLQAAQVGPDAHRCGAIGTYGYTGFGNVFANNAAGLPPGIISSNGTISFDANGNVHIREAEMVDGQLIATAATFQGTYTLNADCTFTATLDPLPGTAFVGVFGDNGKQLRSMLTVAGVQINYVSSVRIQPAED